MTRSPASKLVFGLFDLLVASSQATNTGSRRAVTKLDMDVEFLELLVSAVLFPQVYYDCLGRAEPLSLKSPGAQRALTHLRHPVFLELCVVLWVLPALSLDRLLLAGTLTVYLALAHSLDKQDFKYLCSQLKTKILSLQQQQHSATCDFSRLKEK